MYNGQFTLRIINVVVPARSSPILQKGNPFLGILFGIEAAAYSNCILAGQAVRRTYNGQLARFSVVVNFL